MGKFKFTDTGIEGMFLVEPTVFGDDRGYFMETYNQQDMQAEGLDMVFGVANLIVCVIRVGLIFAVKLLSQEEAGNDEKQLHGDAGARRDLRAEMEHRNEISE